jgi:MIP family channel proteins
MGQMRALAAEFVGTFAFVFFGAGAIVTNQARSGALGVLGVAIAHGVVLAVMVTMFLNISGAHFNPAVTLAMWLTRRVGPKVAGSFIVTQLVAAVAAAAAVKFLFPQIPGEVTGYGVPRIAGDVDLLPAIILEALLTFFWVSAVFGTAGSSDLPVAAGFGVGLTVVAAFVVGAPLTGAALNPARALGPALVANEWIGQAVYWIGPLVGGAVAAFVWGKLLLPRTEA